ncbi:MAG: 1-acyl-sn-glycerol-3-phosphate acyltransferase, partial [Chloroflexota bacterium]
MSAIPVAGFDLSELRFLAARVLLRGLLRLCFRIQVRGLEQVPDRGYVAVANHLNWIDGFLLLAYLPQRPRLFVLGDMQGVYKHGWWKAFLALVGRVMPIDRHGPGGIRAGLDACNEVLRRGDA